MQEHSQKGIAKQRPTFVIRLWILVNKTQPKKPQRVTPSVAKQIIAVTRSLHQNQLLMLQATELKPWPWSTWTLTGSYRRWVLAAADCVATLFYAQLLFEKASDDFVACSVEDWIHTGVDKSKQQEENGNFALKNRNLVNAYTYVNTI